MAFRSPTFILIPLLRALVALVMLCAVATPAFAETADELVKKVEARYADVTSMSASFVQTTRNELFGDETMSGQLLVKRPAMMRWSFGEAGKTPEKLFVTDGKKMWIYTAEDAQVIVYEDIAAQRSTADSLLTSMDKLSEQFDITVVSSGAEGHQLALAPHEEAQFKKVELTLTADLTVEKVVITDTFDNVTELGFTEVKLNVAPSDDRFVFQVPSGVDVIQGTTN